MTRQIALGAVIAFAVTVLALSVWEPKPQAPAPAPRTAVPTAHFPVQIAKPLRPTMLKPDGLTRFIRSPVVVMQQAVDGGASAP